MTTRQFAATPKDSNGTPVTGLSKVWDIGSGPATIDSNGLATATGTAGVVEVGCTAGGVRGTTTWNLQGASTAADSIAALMTALGDNGAGSVVKACYDLRLGRTLNGGGTAVTALADARGSSGFGPTLTPAGDQSRPPTFDPATKEVTGEQAAGTDAMGLISPVSALFNLGVGDKTLFVIAKAQEPTSTATHSLAAIFSAGSLLRIDNVYAANAPTSIRSIPTTTGNTAPASGIAPSATRRAIYATSRAASGGTVECGVLNHAAGSAASDVAQTNESAQLRLMGGGTSSSSESSIVFACVIAGVLSSGQKTALANFAAAQWAVAAAA